MMNFSHKTARVATSAILDMAEEGIISWETLARDLIGWMSEHEVVDFARAKEYFEFAAEEDE